MNLFRIQHLKSLVHEREQRSRVWQIVIRGSKQRRTTTLESFILISSLLSVSLMFQGGNSSDSAAGKTPPNSSSSSATYLDDVESIEGSPVAVLQQKSSRSDADVASKQHDEPPAAVGLVQLLDGAASARDALNAMVAASNAADAEAALLLVDPAIRPLLRPDIALETFAMDATVLQRAMFEEPRFPIGGNLFWFTYRDLIRTRSLKLLDTRIVDERRVVFTVLTTERSYHEDKHIHILRHYLAVQRSGRWYLFRPFGLLSAVLRARMPTALPREQTAVMRVHEPSEKRQNTENADYETEYLLPIELVHEHLVQAAKGREIQQANKIAAELHRSVNYLVGRARRGDYRSRSDLNAAMNPLETLAEKLQESTHSLIPGVQELARQHFLGTGTPSQK